MVKKAKFAVEKGFFITFEVVIFYATAKVEIILSQKNDWRNFWELSPILRPKGLTQPSKKKPHFQACKQKISRHKENGIGVRPGFINKEKNEDENASQ